MSTLQVRGTSGRKLKVTAPTGGYSGNDIIILRSGVAGWCGIVQDDAVAGGTAVVEYGHQVEIPKTTGGSQTFAVGALVYRDVTTGIATITATGNTLIGAATDAAATADAVVWVQLKIA